MMGTLVFKELTVNDCIKNEIFPDDLKLADVSPKFIKED